MEGEVLKVLQNYGKRKVFSGCGSSGIIFTGYGTTTFGIDIIPLPPPTHTHTILTD
jgi:hypothetical protein